MKKDVLKNFAKLTGKHLCRYLLFNRLTGPASNFVKKRIKETNLQKTLQTLYFTLLNEEGLGGHWAGWSGMVISPAMV